MALDLNSLLPQLNVNQDSDAVDGVSVQAQPKGQPAADFQRSIYNNLPDLQMAKQGQQQAPQHTGSFGLHGTLRNVLGTLGDALLIQHGAKPVFAPRLQQEHIADAMTGFQSDPSGAAGRLAAVPGGADDAMKIQENAETNKLRQSQIDANSALRQSQLDSLTQYRQQQQQAKVDQLTQRALPIVGGLVTNKNIKTSDDYDKASQRALGIVQRFNPGATLDDLGLPHPEDWQPGMLDGYGATTGQNQRDATSQDSIAERASASAARNQTTQRGQDMSAGSSGARTAATIRGQDMTDARAKAKHSLNIPGLTPSIGSSAGTMTPQQAAKLAPGTHFTGTDGKEYIKH